MTPQEAHDAATHNRAALQQSDACSCYYCLSVYDAKELREWIDGGTTALCGVCGVDAVIPGLVAEEELKVLQFYWFDGDDE